jgi:hypothetical protein
MRPSRPLVQVPSELHSNFDLPVLDRRPTQRNERRPGCLRNRAFVLSRPTRTRKTMRRSTGRTRTDAAAATSVRLPSRACTRSTSDQLFGEHVTLEHEVVVGFERVERLVQRAGACGTLEASSGGRS